METCKLEQEWREIREEKRKTQEEEVGGREGEMLQCLADKHSVPPELEDEKENGEEGERVGEGGSLMGAVKPTALQQPSCSSSTSQQKIYAGALSIPHTSHPGSAEDGADS